MVVIRLRRAGSKKRPFFRIVVTDARAALHPTAPTLTDSVPGNLCFDWQWGQTAEVADILARAAHVVTIDLNNHRIVTNPMEPRGAVGHRGLTTPRAGEEAQPATEAAGSRWSASASSAWSQPS